MPSGDRTGPLGQGPRTGRGGGFCSGFAVPGFMNRGGGFGRGRGGRGRGWRNQFGATGLAGLGRAWGGRQTLVPRDTAEASTTEPEQELAALKSQVEWLQTTLSEMLNRIKGLGAKPGQE